MEQKHNCLKIQDLFFCDLPLIINLNNLYDDKNWKDNIT